MTWEPSDELVDKAFNAKPLPPMRASREHYRAALIAARDDLVAEAVRAERERADKLADALRRIRHSDFAGAEKLVLTHEWKEFAYRQCGLAQAVLDLDAQRHP